LAAELTVILAGLSKSAGKIKAKKKACDRAKSKAKTHSAA
jgi:hypothetical protein